MTKSRLNRTKSGPKKLPSVRNANRANADICFSHNKDGTWNITKNRFGALQVNLSEAQKRKVIQQTRKSADGMGPLWIYECTTRAPRRTKRPTVKSLTAEVCTLQEELRAARKEMVRIHEHATMDPPPVPLLLWCPECKARHVDIGEFATRRHHSHACQKCGLVWQPSVQATIGVLFLPGFKNA